MNRLAQAGESRDRPHLIQLRPADVDRIVQLEHRCFIPPLQADRPTILKRFELDHSMVGIEVAGQLTALVGYYFTDLQPSSLERLPSTEKQFCELPKDRNANALIIYNLEVEPEQRGLEYSRTLLNFAFQRAQDMGASHVFGNARLPSYAGSTQDFHQEFILANPVLRAAVDVYLSGGRFPDDEVLMQDPRLGLYCALTGCRFLKLLLGYAPYDLASGGMRMLVYRDLLTWRRVS